MERRRRTALARTGTLALLCACAGAAGWATSTLAPGGIAVPGTTITVPTNEDGSVDLRGLDLAALLAGVTLPEGMTLPAGVTLPGGITLPKGMTLPSGSVSPSLLGGTTTGAPATSATTGQPATTAVTPTSPLPTSTTPATAIPNPFGTATQTSTTTTTTASNKTGDRLATVLLVLVGGILLLTALAFAAARVMGWEPDWWSGRRHQTAEAAWRTSNTWADFGDWLRFKR